MSARDRRVVAYSLAFLALLLLVLALTGADLSETPLPNQ